MKKLAMERSIPCWIWHSDRGGSNRLAISVSFNLNRKITGLSCRFALTGRADVSLDGQRIAEIPELAAHTAAFTLVDGFPNVLEAGTHTLTFDIVTTRQVPIVAVNAYLAGRTVGFAAYIEGEDFWLSSDESWVCGDGTAAVVVSRLGEEPFGDLENGPEWFVAGGFGDIVAKPIGNVRIDQSTNAEATVVNPGVVRLTGKAAELEPLVQPRRNDLNLFYHLRKQYEWKEVRTQQKAREWSAASVVRLALPREENARMKVVNNGDAAIHLLWNGAESVYEMDAYDGCISEWFTLEAGASFITLPQGYRFIQLTVFAEQAANFDLLISFDAVGVDLNRVGNVDSDLPLMDQIYDVSAHTSLICHQIGLWDGVKRDRLNWTFDYYLAAKSGYFIWDDYAVLKRAVSEVGEGTQRGYWMNGIPEYTMWWICTLWDYYYHTGDRGFILEMKEPLKRHVAWIKENIDPDTGSMRDLEGALIEWVPISKEDAELGVHAVLRQTANRLQMLAGEIPELELDVRELWTAPEIAAERFLESGVLALALHGIESGYVGEEDARQFLLRYELKDPFTPLSAFQLAEAYSAFEMKDKAWDVIAAVWGKMLDCDSTTFWEGVKLELPDDFHDALTTYKAYDSYRMSLCHAWSSTPIKWISENILGVRIAEPGCRSIVFEPYAPQGASRCSGSVNTPYGPIQVEWKKREDGSLEASIEAPEQIKVVRMEMAR
ncbi:alpha-L-rhamnosidase C-terminal domain-containing protein [Paenibacillus spongiae]|uniref:Alpha-L-rhamnosidase n=1 Tax=Paenibacillus spongiae TaxID=2909671 RepID=A0ABY5S2Y0_9BACL|nr:alpha-L-rhamnosidase C-terminal domain-containing protein [Paenibacillus spongiae]UVI28241.1 alpha-L-rhamnosidase [Paenibacillus spongiae]